MAQLRLPNHPFNPRFALPSNVVKEPPGRGTLTTSQIRRKTFSEIPKGWTGGYTLPDYVMTEPHKRGAAYTHWDRRKTIPMYVTDGLGNNEPLTLALPKEVYSLDGIPPVRPGFAGDPIKEYGKRASEYILKTIKKVPTEFRGIALEALLNEVEPGLWDRVTERANRYKSQGMKDRQAVASAMASAMSEGIAKEMINIGKKGKPALRSQAGLGYYGDHAAQIALEGLWSSIKSGISKVGSAIKSGVTTTTSAVTTTVISAKRAVTYPIRKAAEGIGKGAEYVKDGAQKAWEWGKSTVDKLGSLACSVMNSPAAPVAAGAAASAYGAPPQAGVVGAQVGASLCAKSDVPAAPQDQLMQPQTLPGWVMPAAIGGVGLVAVLLLTKK